MAKRQYPPIWKPDSDGNVPVNAIEIGQIDNNPGDVMYVGRAWFQSDLLPGKVAPSHNCCYVGYDQVEKGQKEYEVLVNEGNCELGWAEAFDGKVPTGAIQGGQVSETGEPLYIGRALVPNGGTHGGKVQPSLGCLSIPYGGTELTFKEYEVLCQVYLFA